MFTYQETINGQTYTFYRSHQDLPNAEVMVQVGDFDAERLPDCWVNSQYATVDTEGAEVDREEMVRAARAFQKARHEAEQAPKAYFKPIAEEKPAGDPATTWQGETSMDAEDSIF
jgi:hypothetical protein